MLSVLHTSFVYISNLANALVFIYRLFFCNLKSFAVAVYKVRIKNYLHWTLIKNVYANGLDFLNFILYNAVMYIPFEAAENVCAFLKNCFSRLPIIEPFPGERNARN